MSYHDARREFEILVKLRKNNEHIEVETEYKKKVKAMKAIQKKDRFVEYVKLTEMEKSDRERGAIIETKDGKMTRRTKK